jgi:hypothetical protein
MLQPACSTGSFLSLTFEVHLIIDDCDPYRRARSPDGSGRRKPRISLGLADPVRLEVLFHVWGGQGVRGKKGVTPAARRAAVTAVREAHGISERRACSIVGADRSTIRYRHRRIDCECTHPRKLDAGEDGLAVELAEIPVVLDGLRSGMLGQATYRHVPL